MQSPRFGFTIVHFDIFFFLSFFFFFIISSFFGVIFWCRRLLFRIRTVTFRIVVVGTIAFPFPLARFLAIFFLFTFFFFSVRFHSIFSFGCFFWSSVGRFFFGVFFKFCCLICLLF